MEKIFYLWILTVRFFWIWKHLWSWHCFILENFQQQKEALYLSALDVTYERFQLGPVPFAGASGQVSQKIDEGSLWFSD